MLDFYQQKKCRILSATRKHEPAKCWCSRVIYIIALNLDIRLKNSGYVFYLHNYILIYQNYKVLYKYDKFTFSIGAYFNDCPLCLDSLKDRKIFIVVV